MQSAVGFSIYWHRTSPDFRWDQMENISMLAWFSHHSRGFRWKFQVYFTVDSHEKPTPSHSSIQSLIIAYSHGSVWFDLLRRPHCAPQKKGFWDLVLRNGLSIGGWYPVAETPEIAISSSRWEVISLISKLWATSGNWWLVDRTIIIWTV